MTDDRSQVLLELQHVGKRYPRQNGLAGRLLSRLKHLAPAPADLVAVDDVSLHIRAKEIVGLVGESGCGKSTLARLAAGLQPLSSGVRLWKGRDLSQLRASERGQSELAMQLVFQDATASLNPRLRVREIIGEAPVAHGMIGRKNQESFVAEMLERVGLQASWMQRFPHQFSGGQRARIGIARALAVQPELLICDESVAALDVSIQAQVLNLFLDLRDDMGLAYLFISHDLSVVRHIADRVLVMYLGRVIESGNADDVFFRPAHPYTVQLLDAAPTLDATPDSRTDAVTVQSDQPSPLAPPSGCHFHPRCPHAMERCLRDRPAMQEVAPGHMAACHLHDRRT